MAQSSDKLWPAQSGARGLPVNLIVFTNKQYQLDFRKYLLRVAERSGAKTLHLSVRGNVVLSWAGAERAEYSTNCDPHELRGIIEQQLEPGPALGLTGLGGTRLDDPGAIIATELHRELLNIRWVYDVYDDLLFGAGGSERVRRLIADAVWRCRCEHSIILAPELRSRYPTAYHLDNASHVEHLPSVAKIDTRKMVYIGSIDRRVDFEWLDALAANDVTVAIFGSIHPVGADETQQQLDALIQRRPNVSFHGSYDNDDLPAILSQFRVGLLPYRVGDPMTDHVNPDKLHHYLNAGLEVLASPIPAARRLERYLHLMTTGGDWATVLGDLRTTRLQESWPRESNTWDRRWTELVNLVLPDQAATLTRP
jgi:hypothetical protein